MLEQKEIEKIPVKIFSSSDEASVFVANEVADLIKSRQKEGQALCFGFSHWLNTHAGVRRVGKNASGWSQL